MLHQRPSISQDKKTGSIESPQIPDEYIVLKRPTPHFDGVNSNLGIEDTKTSDKGNGAYNSKSLNSTQFRTYEQQLGYKIMPFGRQRIYEQTRKSTPGWFIFLFTMCVLVGLFVGSIFGYQPDIYSIFQSTLPEVAQAFDTRIVEGDYDKWAENKFTNLQKKDSDPDNDGLTNFVEFMLNSDPSKQNSCEIGGNDLDQLFMYINPGTCKAFNWNNTKDTTIFLETLRTEPVGKSFINKFNVEINPSLINPSPITETGLGAEIPDTPTIQTYLNETLDSTTLNSPILAETLVELSSLYSVDVTKVMAIMELQTRFGTENTEYKNIALLGFSGNNTYSFGSWEGGLETLFNILLDFEAKQIPECIQLQIITSKDSKVCKDIDQIQLKITQEINANKK